MTNFCIYKLFFTSPLHISDHHNDDGYSLKSISSDTLYAAMLACLAKTGRSIPDDGDLGFTISSLFPYYQKDEGSYPTYFLPMPLYAHQIELADVTMAKKVKKVKWVDASLYNGILSGEDLSDHLSDIQESYLSKQPLPTGIDGTKEFVKAEVSQRVTLVSRTGDEDAMPYYVEKIVFKHHSGLYFIAQGDTSLLEEALRLLSLEGIGSDRNIGFGFFDFSSDQLSMDLPQDADHQIALSLLIPESEEQMKQLLDSDNVAYDFTRRGGWITTYPFSTLRKNAIYGFLPGSVFSKAKEKECMTIGKIINLQPEVGELSPTHPIWRCGRSIMLPIKLK